MGEAADLPADGMDSKHRLIELFDKALERLGRARAFAKANHRTGALDVARRLAGQAGGVEALYLRVDELDRAGLFDDSDWQYPATLKAGLAANTLWQGDRYTAMLEYLNELRFLAIAMGDYQRPDCTKEQAQHFLSQVVALNLNALFGGDVSEAGRQRTSALDNAAVRDLYRYLAERIGLEGILDRLIAEIWRILAQRPILVDSVKSMINQIASILYGAESNLGASSTSAGGAGYGADRLVSALYGPTLGCREDPGLGIYAQRLEVMDGNALQQEAGGFARAMHDTGLVSPYHPVFLRFVVQGHADLLPAALGLSSTGQEALSSYSDLIRALVMEAVHPETSQAVYGLAQMLERGVLFMPPLAPALWRQISMPINPVAADLITSVCGGAHPPSVFLLAGVLNVIGQPFGVGQGNNPTCQAARALSMWAHDDPGYLLQMVVWAARDDEVIMHFEGQAISSRSVLPEVQTTPPRDVDPVSLLLVPHLDSIYHEMGRLCAGRPGDPHQWINPEFHGWWVGRGCRLAVDVPTGQLSDYEGFVSDFIAIYHPLYNGNRPQVHPQPAGIAVTDSLGRFVGWHAITITRVGLDPSTQMRVYFFNPNNDSGQDWGCGALVSTEGCGEQYGESSLPMEQFASRLYLFHFDPLDQWLPLPGDDQLIQDVTALGRATWAKDR